ncbi:MAG: signal peptidase I [Candidatus Lokiarchaeota archaeon]
MTSENKKRKNSLKLSSKQKKIIIGVVMIGIAFGGSFATYFGMQFFWNTSTPVVVVVSGSMEPTYNIGDLLFVHGKSPDNIQIGDVIIYDARGLWWGAPNDPIVHRVINKTLVGDTWYFQTKGDNNNEPDPALVPEGRVLGVVFGGIPYIGYAKIILTDSGLLIPAIVILVSLLIISIIWDIMKGKDESSKKKEDSNKDIQKE